MCYKNPWHWSLPDRLSFKAQLWSWYLLLHHKSFMKLKVTSMSLFQHLDKTLSQLSTLSCFVNSYSFLTKLSPMILGPSWSLSMHHSQTYSMIPLLASSHSHSPLYLEYHSTSLSRRGIIESYGKTKFHFLTDCQIVLQSGCTILRFHQQCSRVPVSPHSHQHCCLSSWF